MKKLLFLSLKKSKLINSILVLLFALAFIQGVFYFLFKEVGFKEVGQLKEQALEVGYLIGFLGFLAGISGVLFLIIRNHRSEMGALETLGYSRLSYGFSFVLQITFVLLIGLFLGISISIAIYATPLFLKIPTSDLVLVMLRSAIIQMAVFLPVTALFVFLISLSDPYLMVKIK